ncbi:MAG: acetolactate synthase small subunit [Holophaga sp.]|nr:acetolactate synthase small subunit [Holophaga sp.]
MLRILVATTDNEPGVLDRIASTFRRRCFNIHSLTVSPTLDPTISRMTLVTDLDAKGARSAKAVLERLTNVHTVEDLTEVTPALRDLALFRVAATADMRPTLFQMAQMFRAEVLDVSRDSLVLSVCASPERIEGLMEALRPFGILEFGRTGAVAMRRGVANAIASLAPTEAVVRASSF